MITDRYMWSTIAFGAVDLDRNWLVELHKYCFMPDLSFFMKITPARAIKRLKSDRFDLELFEKEEKMKQVWKNYEWLASEYHDTIIMVDADRPIEVIAKEIMEHVKRHPKYKVMKKSND